MELYLIIIQLLFFVLKGDLILICNDLNLPKITNNKCNINYIKNYSYNLDKLIESNKCNQNN